MTRDRFHELRKLMVDIQLRGRDITSPAVLDAFSRVPRHLFVAKGREDWAYEDYPLGIGHQQTISQPYIVALMTQALELKKTDRILEIGTGSGYQTAILAELGGMVYSVERIRALQEQAKQVLFSLEHDNLLFKVGNGCDGWREHAPFDKIIVTAAARDIPEALIAQLQDGGRMVIPVGGSFFQKLLVIEKEDGHLRKTGLCDCRFVELVDRD